MVNYDTIIQRQLLLSFYNSIAFAVIRAVASAAPPAPPPSPSAASALIEVLQAVEEPTHVGDGRDVPVSWRWGRTPQKRQSCL